ncbi:MAG: AMP-binding protein [Victivallaceae bacterium]
MKKDNFSWRSKNRKEQFSFNSSRLEFDSLLENFFFICDSFKSSDACIDSTIGRLSYSDLKRTVLAIALFLRKLPDTKIGIMLPASAAAVICYFAVMLAGKLPVMVNWTMGKRELAFIKDEVDFDKIITSKIFLSKLQEKGFPPSSPFNMVYLEDIKSSLSIFQKLRAGFLSFRSFDVIKKIFKIEFSKTDIAVLLFTSGTEGSPKCVPLTHNNLLSNQRSSGDYLKVQEDLAIFLSALPPFHALGFNITCLLPLLAGIRIVFEPNPLNGKTLARAIEKYGVTIICLTPTFLMYLLHGLKDPEQLHLVELIVLGGEPAAAAHYEMVKSINPKTDIIQGYGVTECSPVITIVPRGSNLRGVGLQIKDMSLAIVCPETFERLSQGCMGLIIIKGTSLFKGYLNCDGTLDDSSFIDFEGNRWYKTGDLGILDPTGSLIIKGRQKRFVKIGGEMISLAAVEEILIDAFKDKMSTGENLGLAVHGLEYPGEKAKLYLFTTFQISPDEVATAFKNAETSNLIKISYIKQLSRLPVLGIGKIDYKELAKIAESMDSN